MDSEHRLRLSQQVRYQVFREAHVHVDHSWISEMNIQAFKKRVFNNAPFIVTPWLYVLFPDMPHVKTGCEE